MDILKVTWSTLALVLGLIVGSFLNVCIYRLPLSQSIVYPGSRCPSCDTSLKWYHNIPVVSFMLLRGRCAFCGASISPVYPLVELCMGLLSLSLFIYFGFTVRFVCYFLLAAALVVVAFIDLKTRIIPDAISLPGMVVGLLSSFVRSDISFWESLAGLLIGGGSLLLVSLGYYALTKREGMGMGDVKLMGMIGAFLGWRSILFVILSGSFLGAISGMFLMFKNREDSKLAIPFGPFLSLGALLYIFWGSSLMAWYFHLLR